MIELHLIVAFMLFSMALLDFQASSLNKETLFILLRLLYLGFVLFIIGFVIFETLDCQRFNPILLNSNVNVNKILTSLRS